ncbi:hypothetical protein EDC94DRAFT_583803 [Helicostylum pulchrum]|nr:hypothetical protein EDC94DRAFT_583803 [Helicostylum pulchrum]
MQSSEVIKAHTYVQVNVNAESVSLSVLDFFNATGEGELLWKIMAVRSMDFFFFEKDDSFQKKAMLLTWKWFYCRRFIENDALKRNKGPSLKIVAIEYQAGVLQALKENGWRTRQSRQLPQLPQLKEKRKGKEKEVEKEIVSDDTIPLNKVLDTSSSNHNTDEVRTFTTSISKIFRKDLPKDILRQFLSIISNTLVESTDYITTYGVQLFKMLIQFKDKRFELDEANNVVLSSIQGPKLKEYLPSDFNVYQPNQCSPPAPDRDL